MGLFDGIGERLGFFRKLAPSEVKKLANRKLSDVITQEMGRAKERVAELEQRYPSAGTREKGQRLIDSKKSLASMVGGVSGVFGLASVPADWVVMTWLQLALLVDLATLHKINLRTDRAQTDLLDLFGFANGIGSIQRAGPKVLGKLAGTLLEKGGIEWLGRSLPLVAAPVTAYLNNQHIQAVGDQAVRFYEGFEKVHRKTRAKD